MIVAILLALAVVLAWLVIWVKRRRAALGPYALVDGLLSDSERTLAEALEQALADRYRLLAKVGLTEIFSVELATDSKGWKEAIDALTGKHVDFVICDRARFSPLALVKLSGGRRHGTSGVDDDWLVALCHKVGVPLLMVEPRRSYDVAELRRLLATAMASDSDDLLGEQGEIGAPLIAARDELRPADKRRAETRSGRSEPRLTRQRSEPQLSSSPPARVEPKVSPAAPAKAEPLVASEQPQRVASRLPTAAAASREPAAVKRQPAFGRARRDYGDEPALGALLATSSAAEPQPPQVTAASQTDGSGHAPHCPRCNATMVRVRPKDPLAAPFWSCSGYPNCRTTLSDSAGASEPTDGNGVPSFRAER